MQKVDYIIAGLGLSGAAIAWQLTQRGKTVAVFDVPDSNRSSFQAAGLFNPITGKLLTKTWMADQIFPYLHSFYTGIEKITGEKFFHPSPIYIPFRTIKEQNDWSRQSETSHKIFTAPAYSDQVHDEMGGLLLSGGGYLHVRGYLQTTQRMLAEKHVVRGTLDTSQVRFESDGLEFGDLWASHLIFCDGVSVRRNPLTAGVPVRPLKGETLDITTGVELRAVYNRGIYIVPNGDGKYRVGATYERTEEPGITVAARHDLEQRLKALLRIPFSVIGQDWGIRPTVPDRRPLLGALPAHSRAIIFNGMGTKGVSLTPYFSKVLADYLEGKGQIPDEVNISRFYTLSWRSGD
jgi:glycine/D-amino acid oxidase-like deaminating enzyme